MAGAELTPEVLVGIVGAVVGTIGIVVGAWAAWRSAHPRRWLYVAVADDTALAGGGVHVERDGQEFTDPRLVDLRLTLRSRVDIIPDDFTGEIVLGLGVPVVVREVRLLPPVRLGLPAPEVRARGYDVVIPASHLAGTMRLSVVVLADGAPNLSPITPLRDVEVRHGEPPQDSTARLLSATAALLVVAWTSVVVVAGAGSGPSRAFATAAPVLAAVMVLAGLYLWFRPRG